MYGKATSAIAVGQSTSHSRRTSEVSRVRDKIVDSPNSIGARSRMRRWKLFQSLFPDVAEMRVVDLGGTAESWLRAPVRPRRVVVLNLAEGEAEAPPWIVQQQGDACSPPPAVAGDHFDLVFSNSLIEHVGGHFRRQQLADMVHKLAGRHWIQTPYRYFPIEPHWIFPGFQFLPVILRAKLSRWWPLMHTPAKSDLAALHNAMDVELLSKTEMAYYFPHSRIIPERIGPLTKSLVAVRQL